MIQRIYRSEVIVIELVIFIVIIAALIWLSFQLAGCLVGIIRIAAILFLLWCMYVYIIVPLWPS